MERIDLNFGVFEIHSQIIIGKMKEGIHYDIYKNKMLIKLIDTFYGTIKPFSYVCVRDKTYSIDPMIHKYNSRYENLCSIAVVERNLMSRSTVQIESKFFKPGKFCKFQSVTDAIVWADHQIALKRLEINHYKIYN
ncbi:hypothetical protein BST92_12500 [Nonlabens arenilitoris]|uniref:STAS/SEC14 domain-containing protein n=1 Tax=Nonlabens arenilitoris TaxID=1217969 RepID=A0A2S7UCN5_9FLAO|nr:hypothetical protein [Nonlabens arenilitoris]PQJ32695.1 hypothetical protein BST92_12500 [Nonlabens arenilitoris]